MRSTIYLYQFLVLLLWIGVVVLLFKLIPEKQIAAVIAGVGFILWPSLFFVYEWNQKPKDKMYLLILGIFLMTCALPIFLLRVLNSRVEFSTLSLIGIPAGRFHGTSNIVYLLVMLMTLICYYKAKKTSK